MKLLTFAQCQDIARKSGDFNSHYKLDRQNGQIVFFYVGSDDGDVRVSVAFGSEAQFLTEVSEAAEAILRDAQAEDIAGQEKNLLDALDAGFISGVSYSATLWG